MAIVVSYDNISVVPECRKQEIRWAIYWCKYKLLSYSHVSDRVPYMIGSIVGIIGLLLEIYCGSNEICFAFSFSQQINFANSEWIIDLNGPYVYTSHEVSFKTLHQKFGILSLWGHRSGINRFINKPLVPLYLCINSLSYGTIVSQRKLRPEKRGGVQQKFAKISQCQ